MGKITYDKLNRTITCNTCKEVIKLIDVERRGNVFIHHCYNEFKVVKLPKKIIIEYIFEKYYEELN